jgi:hypothetical protein
MSIYATLWQIRLPAPEWDVLLLTQHGEFRLEEGELVPHEEHWVEITFQGVPGHIGHPSCNPDGDPYASFLPPVVDDPEKLRAVVVVQEGRHDKDVQRYVDPLLTLSGDQYQAMPFEALMRKIYEAMKRSP